MCHSPPHHEGVHLLEGMKTRLEQFIFFPGDEVLSKESLIYSDHVEETGAGHNDQLAGGLENLFSFDVKPLHVYDDTPIRFHRIDDVRLFAGVNVVAEKGHLRCQVPQVALESGQRCLRQFC